MTVTAAIKWIQFKSSDGRNDAFIICGEYRVAITCLQQPGRVTLVSAVATFITTISI